MTGVTGRRGPPWGSVAACAGPLPDEPREKGDETVAEGYACGGARFARVARGRCDFDGRHGFDGFAASDSHHAGFVGAARAT